jgi:hypothetical protein
VGAVYCVALLVMAGADDDRIVENVVTALGHFLQLACPNIDGDDGGSGELSRTGSRRTPGGSEGGARGEARPVDAVDDEVK